MKSRIEMSMGGGHSPSEGAGDLVYLLVDSSTTAWVYTESGVWF
ncbi:hypothetical protein [Paenibacillus hexagrammi]|nr:hypothetical protein [Paenibacillus sp. YPD9-1]